MTITYAPNQTGYFAESLEIIKTTIASLRKNTSEDFDLTVFDNGSCPEVQNELVKLNQAGIIDFLTLSPHNSGKIGGLNWAVASMPNEWIVYSDADFLFREHWFEQSLKLAAEFPEAGLITAQPNFFDILEGKSHALDTLDQNALQVTHEKLDRAVVEEYCKGIGVSDEARQKFLSMDSTILRRKTGAIQAVFGSCPAQFMSRREVLQQVFPLPHEFVISREEDNEIIRKVDRMGWLELSTFVPYVVHMGNHLDEAILQEIKASGLSTEAVTIKKASREHKSNFAWKTLVVLNRVGFLRKVFKRLYLNLFELYSIEKK